jgi:hypothetical protein
VKRAVHRVTLPDGITVCRAEEAYVWNWALVTLFAGRYQVQWHRTKKSAHKALKRCLGFAVLESVTHG